MYDIISKKLKPKVIEPLKESLKRRNTFWKLAHEAAKYYPLSKFEKIPETLIIEPTNICNINCLGCPTSSGDLSREKGLMDFDTFKSIIDDLNRYKTKPRIAMNFAGEPTLNNDLGNFVKYAEMNGHSTIISTNATRLNKFSEKIMEYGSEIRLCLDGMSAESHEAYRKGSDFNDIKSNIEKFCSIKSSGESDIEIILQTLLTKHSVDEIDGIKDFAEMLDIDKISFKKLSTGGWHTSKEEEEAYKKLMPNKSKYLRDTINYFEKKTLCTVPLRQGVIYWNGDLAPCCIAYDKIADMPNVKEKGFVETFRSKDAKITRKKAFLKELDHCSQCSLGKEENIRYTVKI